jgi:large subunit ribosomal protein L28
MIRKCAICEKGPQTGKSVTRKGALKKKGGTGSKITRWTKRKFLPNLQKMRIVLDGRARQAYVCAKCMKKGSVKRAVTPLFPLRSASTPSVT